MLTYADVRCRMLTYADVCCAIHTGLMAASGAEQDADGSIELTYADADAAAAVQDADGQQSLTMLRGCSHIFMLTYADVWCRMLTYADVC